MDWARVQIPQEKVGLELCKRREDGVIDFQVRELFDREKSQISDSLTRHPPNILIPTFCDLGVLIWNKCGCKCRGNGVSKEQNRRQEAKRAALLSKMKKGCLTHPPGAPARATGLKVPFRHIHASDGWSMPRLFSTYTSYLPLSSSVAWRIASWRYCRSQRTHSRWEEGAGRAWDQFRRVAAGVLSSILRRPVPRPRPTPASFWTPPRPSSRSRYCPCASPRPHLSSSSTSSPFLAQPMSGAGSPRISAISITVAPLRALVLSCPF